MTIYEAIKANNIPHDNHYSDLYVLASADSKALIKKYHVGVWPQTFKCNVTRKLYYDIPLSYDPYWERKNKS